MGQFTKYSSTDSGAPVLSGTASAMINLLQAILIDGWTASVSSITRSGSTATVTTATAHGFVTGNQTTIAGASQTEYNGTFTVTVTGTTTFTITVSGTPATPATGTITWKKLGAGWTKPFTGTNKAVFKNGGGCQMYFRIDDTGGGTGGQKECKLNPLETMSDVDTGTGWVPVGSGYGVIRKSATADATARAWKAWSDSRTLYFFALSEGGSVYTSFSIGEFYSLGSSDAYRNRICARNAENSGATTTGLDGLGTVGQILTTLVPACHCPRGYTGTGSFITLSRTTDSKQNSSSSNFIGVLPYPNPVDGGIYIAPVWLGDNTTAPTPHVRGLERGLWAWLHSTITGVNDGDVFSGTGDLAGKTFELVKQSCGSGIYVIETSNTLSEN